MERYHMIYDIKILKMYLKMYSTLVQLHVKKRLKNLHMIFIFLYLGIMSSELRLFDGNPLIIHKSVMV